MWMQWEPSILLPELMCANCHEPIAVKSMFSMNPDDIKNLIQTPNYNYNNKAYSVRCADCAIEDHIEHMLRQAADSGSSSGGSARESIKSVVKNEMDPGKLIFETIRSIVREELKQILKEEAFDPHGPFSPAP